LKGASFFINKTIFPIIKKKKEKKKNKPVAPEYFIFVKDNIDRKIAAKKYKKFRVLHIYLKKNLKFKK
jgi:hypothetical protein